jgi:hypothetical protein
LTAFWIVMLSFCGSGPTAGPAPAARAAPLAETTIANTTTNVQPGLLEAFHIDGFLM